MQLIAVIDYGMGNLRSVSKAVETACSDSKVVVSSDPDVLSAADKIVCPGQGAAKDCMNALHSSSLDSLIGPCTKEKPFLGICMGMQVLMTSSDENDGVDCLDIVPGQVHKFDDNMVDEKGQRLKVPHMGWSPVLAKIDHPLWRGIEQNSRFYFAHSYYIEPDDKAVAAASCHYGSDIVVAIATDNIFACQFHPEKSSSTGLQLLRNFGQWDGQL